jgi:5-methylthioadenosine/S-adenosylhomocysteine deaminase
MPAPNKLQYALEGRVVTMDAANTVLDRGRVYIDSGRIVAVNPVGAPPPSGYDRVPVIKPGGTIYPGLIELHNHLSYNVLQLWEVSERYTNRSQWSGGRQAYRKAISGPMQVLGRSPGYVEAVVRYAECKCLLGGVTTSQGIALYSNQGISRYYRGLVRNVEQPEGAGLRPAATRIADVEAVNAERFLARLQRSTCLLLHLSEGTDSSARRHFEALQLSDGSWAITPALAGIHCVALDEDDFAVLAMHEAAMVWSPLSNLLLYGATANIKAAKRHGVRLGLGSDWSPSGSKNLLGELKVARLVSEAEGGVFTDLELVAMATRNAAEILRWDHALGSLEVGKFADLMVVDGLQGDPYAKLLEARETNISLVVIDGMPRCGRPRLMASFGVGTEAWRVGRAERLLNLEDEAADLDIHPLTLHQASERLREGLRRLPELALELEQPRPRAVEEEPQWFLLLDHEEPEGVVQRPYLSTGLEGLEVARGLIETRALAVPLSQLLEPLELDALTVADDRTFLTRLGRQTNLPPFIKEGLAALY